jgi:hypothetical protein
MPSSEETPWLKLQFVKKWDTFSTDQKNVYFGEYFSHELNFFIKKHDSAYFDKVVRPFLASKMQKHFVDLWLLDHDEKLIATYANNQVKIQQTLNAFEKCLLIQVFNRNGKQNLAQNLFN